MKYFVFTYSGKPLGESGETCNTSYDLKNACTKCGTGAVLSGNLRVRVPNNIKKDLFETLDGDYLISENLYQNLILQGCKLGSLKKVLNKSGSELPFLHINPTLHLPKALKKPGLVTENQCPVCKQNGYFSRVEIGNPAMNIPTIVFAMELTYQQADIDSLGAVDIINTWERTGLSNLHPGGKYIIRYARPLLIVSDKVRSVFEANNLSNIEFEEIIVV